MEKNTKDAYVTYVEGETGAASSLPAGRVLELPGGDVYYHTLQDLQPDQEGANLLDLQRRQSSLPLFSSRTKSVIDFF